MDNREEKFINCLTLIPIFGAIIIMFYGAFKINNTSKNIFKVYGFMLLSILIISAICLLFIGIGYWFLFNDNIVVRIISLVVIAYISYLASALILKTILKSILEKQKNNDKTK